MPIDCLLSDYRLAALHAPGVDGMIDREEEPIEEKQQNLFI